MVRLSTVSILGAADWLTGLVTVSYSVLIFVVDTRRYPLCRGRYLGSVDVVVLLLVGAMAMHAFIFLQAAKCSWKPMAQPCCLKRENIFTVALCRVLHLWRFVIDYFFNVHMSYLNYFCDLWYYFINLSYISRSPACFSCMIIGQFFCLMNASISLKLRIDEACISNNNLCILCSVLVHDLDRIACFLSYWW
jgi:hypothetical protein